MKYKKSLKDQQYNGNLYMDNIDDDLSSKSLIEIDLTSQRWIKTIKAWSRYSEEDEIALPI